MIFKTGQYWTKLDKHCNPQWLAFYTSPCTFQLLCCCTH